MLAAYGQEEPPASYCAKAQFTPLCIALLVENSQMLAVDAVMKINDTV